MGKSAGKWIKTVLFRKKSSKSSFAKKAVVEEVISVSKGSSGDLALNPAVISDPVPHASNESGTKRSLGVDSSDTSEIIRQEQAATMVQAAFRGYLDHRSFRALKGIVRLQAFIRGQLVRRQATATLHCIRGIVKLQVLIRERRVRVLDGEHEALRKCSPGKFLPVDPFELETATKPEKLFTNAFIRKLLASSPSTMPLHLHYDLVELNSAWKWLERWSSFIFWKRLPQQKQVPGSKFHTKESSIQTGETDLGRPKRAVWRIPAVNAENNSSYSASELGKPKHNLRKSLSHQAELGLGNPQSELERVKQNLRKISASNPGAPDGSEAVPEKPKLSLRKVARSPAPDVPENIADNSSKKLSVPTVVVTKDFEQPEIETSPKPSAVKETVAVLNEDQPAELLPLENNNVENIPMVDEELNSRDEQSSKNNQRTRRRRSFSAKQEYPENISHNTPTLPSYMAATESAKAKLRGQGSPRLGQDEVENGFIRRHSLPSSNNGKLSSMSPQKQRLVHDNGKGRSRSDRSLLSSRDGNEKQVAWRR